MTSDEVYTPAQAAKILKVSEFTVLRMLRDRRLSGFKVGRQWRVSRLDLDKFMKEQGSRGLEDE